MSHSLKIQEILVIFFVIISLIAVFSGVLEKMYQQKNKMICIGNLRHIKTAMELYQKNYGDISSSWKKQVQDFLFTDTVLDCPQHISFTKDSYAMNRSLPNVKEFTTHKAVVLFDALSQLPEVAPEKIIHNRHLGGVNLLFLDGSVEYIPAMQKGWASQEIGWISPGDLLWSLK